MRVLAVATLALSLVATVSASYMASCQSCNPPYGAGNMDYPILRCRCSGTGGKWWWTQINLNRCLTNNDGQMAGQLNGNFAGSCADISMNDGHNLHGFCWPKKGAIREGWVDLDPFMHNWDGALVCHGVAGEKWA